MANPIEIRKFSSRCSRLPNSAELARLIILCRIDGQLAGELARSVVDLIARRKREFAKLTVRDVCRESTYLLMVSFFNRSSLFVHCRFSGQLPESLRKEFEKYAFLDRVQPRKLSPRIGESRISKF